MRYACKLCFISCLMSVSLIAQTAELALEEITVTARKKTESLQEVPISINVVSGDDIKNQGYRDLPAITAEIPAVNLNRAGASSFVNVRGVGSDENAGFEQSVGFIIDGVPLGRSRATGAGILDLERVEILKGPQTTYFGANTIAGVMNLTTKAPSLEDGLTGYVSGSYEVEAEEMVLEAAANIPVSNTFALRLAGKVTDSEGFFTNPVTGQNWTGTEDKVFRAYALWAPTDDLTIKLKVDDIQTDANAGMDLQLIRCVPGAAQGNCIQADGNPVETNFDYSRSTDLTGEFRYLDMNSVTLTLDWDIGDFTLTSLTGWYQFDAEFLFDLDTTSVAPVGTGPAISRFAVNQVDDADGASQEFRIASPSNGRFFWEAGIYYQQEDMLFSNVALPTFAPAPLQQGARNGQESKNWSVFGLLNYDITDRLSASFGVRYIESEKDARQSPVQNEIGFTGAVPDARNFLPTGGFTYETDSRKDDDTLPSFDLRYALSDDINVYGSFRQGFKAGGYSLSNPPSGQLVDYIQTFDPETVDAYEIGTKGVYWDGRMSINAALFYMEYDNRQVSVLAEGEGLSQNVANAATSTSQGLELDFVANLSDRLVFRGAFSLLDSEFDTFDNAPCYTGQTEAQGCIPPGTQDLSGHKTTFAPEFSGSLTLTYEVPLNSYNLTIEPNVYYTDQYWTISNFYPESLQDGFAKFNLRVALAPDTDKWEVAFVGRNLNDEATQIWCQGAPASSGSIFCDVADPATYAIQGRLNF